MTKICELNFLRRPANNAAYVLMGFLFVFIGSGCHSEADPTSILNLLDIEDDQVMTYINLNEEHMANASANFFDIPGSDSVRLELSGLHPIEKIKLEVSTTPDQTGEILFAGEKKFSNERLIKVDGTYRIDIADDGRQSKSLNINVSYRVPWWKSNRNYIIVFDDKNGFRYQRYANFQTSSQADSCRFICNRINEKLAKYLEAMCFSFGPDGNMEFRFITSDQQIHSQLFRYWVSKQSWSGDYIVQVEQPDQFYNSIIRALTPSNQISIESSNSWTRNTVATLFLEEFPYPNKRSIAFVDDIHQNIFPYFCDMNQQDEEWTLEEMACLDLMRRATEVYLNTIPEVYNCYTWSFASTIF